MNNSQGNLEKDNEITLSTKRPVIIDRKHST